MWNCSSAFCNTPHHYYIITPLIIVDLKLLIPFTLPGRINTSYFSALCPLFLNVGISLQFQQWFPAALDVGFAACWESKNHYSGHVEVMDIILKGLSGGCQKERHFPKANLGSVLTWNLSMVVVCSSQACRPQWCICTPKVMSHLTQIGQCCMWNSAAQRTRKLPVLWDLMQSHCAGHAQPGNVNDAQEEGYLSQFLHSQSNSTSQKLQYLHFKSDGRKNTAKA